jgi:hypothetical protein
VTLNEYQQTRRAQRARARLPVVFALAAAAILVVFAIGFTLKAVF